jgi:hypothetical protein
MGKLRKSPPTSLLYRRGALPYGKTQEESAYEPLAESLRRGIPENVFPQSSAPHLYNMVYKVSQKERSPLPIA